MQVFIWDDKNVEHIGEHGVRPDEAESVVQGAEPPYPMVRPDGKFLVWGQTKVGRYLQVIFVERTEDQVEFESLDSASIAALAEGDAIFLYVIHAMELNRRMKRQRKRREK